MLWTVGDGTVTGVFLRSQNDPPPTPAREEPTPPEDRLETVIASAALTEQVTRSRCAASYAPPINRPGNVRSVTRNTPTRRRVDGDSRIVPGGVAR